MGDYVHLAWDRDHAKLKGFNTSNRGGKSTVKIEIEVCDPYTLGRLLSDLQEAQTPKAQPKPAVEPRRALPRPRAALPAPLLALPAPEENRNA